MFSDPFHFPTNEKGFLLRAVRPKPPIPGTRAMRRQIADSEIRFACTDCGDCCVKPWRVPVEEGKIQTIHDFDWGAAHPDLANRTIIQSTPSPTGTQHVLSKSDDGSCIFYDRGKRHCILHAELGFGAKPHICQQYPFMAAPAPDGDRIYALFSCPAIRLGRGPPLSDKRDAIRRIVKPTPGWQRPDVRLTQSRTIGIDACGHLSDRLADCFAVDAPGSMWDRFADALARIVAVVRTVPDEEHAALSDPDLGRNVVLPRLTGYASLREAPLTPRVLLGISLWSDFFPPDSLGRSMSFRQRMSMTMKLMQLVQFRGAYASCLLERNVSLRELDRMEIIAPVPHAAADLIRRWIRSCLVARSFSINELTMLAGLHELILDFNAVVFMARALAADTHCPPTDDMYTTALNAIVSHVSAQQRWYRVLFRFWTLANLDSPDSTWNSLRLFHPLVPTQQGTAARRGASNTHIL